MYQAAIAGGKKCSLTYVKLLALGPGQVGKSTFLYQLLGLMKGNIEDTPKESQPQGSTGQSELREVCIKYKNTVVAAAPDLSFPLCELQSRVEGLMWLLSNQTQDEDHQSTGMIASSPDVSKHKSSLVPYSGKFSRSANFRVFRGCSLVREIKIQTFQYLEDRRTTINRTLSCSSCMQTAMR